MNRSTYPDRVSVARPRRRTAGTDANGRAIIHAAYRLGTGWRTACGFRLNDNARTFENRPAPTCRACVDAFNR